MVFLRRASLEVDNLAQDICREFGRDDDANEWRKSTKEAGKDKDFYRNLES